MATPDKTSGTGPNPRPSRAAAPPRTEPVEAGRKLLRIAADGRHAAVVDRVRVQLVPGAEVPGTKYRLIRWLGDVTVGTVYEAEDVEANELVSLEVLRPDLGSDGRAVRRARAEARVANDLGSPNIARLYEFGELSDGRPMIVREHLHGARLCDESAALAPGRLVPVLRQLCKALAAAHSVGIVHGDIKPENVHLVTVEGRTDTVKLTGFGIASLLDGNGELGRTAGGSPYYLAPERWRGEVREPKADVYAVGCLAYEAWSGHPPFMGGDLDDIMDGHLNGEAAGLPTADGSEALAQVVMRCLAKDPDARFENVEELEAAVIEAQIHAGWMTPWDDLPAPEIGQQRKRALIEGLAGLSVSARLSSASTLALREAQDTSARLGKARSKNSAVTWAWLTVVVVLAGGVAVWSQGAERLIERLRLVLQPQVAAQVGEDGASAPAVVPATGLTPVQVDGSEGVTPKDVPANGDADGTESAPAVAAPPVVEEEDDLVIEEEVESRPKKKKKRRIRQPRPAPPVADFSALPGPEDVVVEDEAPASATADGKGTGAGAAEPSSPPPAKEAVPPDTESASAATEVPPPSAD